MTDSIRASEAGLGLERAARRRGGVTLIELLIVMALIVLLAGLTLPSVRTLLKDQRISQSARVVQGFIESARARAVASNRPVAVIFEREGQVDTDLVGLATCTRMSIGEVFPPYEGDWAGATGTLQDSDTDGYADAIDIPMAQAATLSSLVTNGDFIELNRQKLGFSVSGTPTTSPNDPTSIRVQFLNPFQYTDTTKQNAITVYSSEKRLPMVGATTNVPFRIYRKPTKTMSGTVVLPRGTCIDLAWSGIGPTGTSFGTSTGATSKRSIFIMFNSTGTIDSIYELQQSSSGAVIPPVPPVMGIVHLLVGRTDQINLPTTQASDRDNVKANVVDTGNNWVSINAFTGRVYSSDVAAPTTTPPTVAQARFFATQGVNKKGT